MTHLWLVSIACWTFQKQQKSRHSWKWTNKNPKTEVCFRWVPKAQCWMIFRFQVTFSKKKTTKLKRSQVPMEHLKICYVFTSSLNNPPPQKKKKKRPPFWAPPPMARLMARFEDRGWWLPSVVLQLWALPRRAWHRSTASLPSRPSKRTSDPCHGASFEFLCVVFVGSILNLYKKKLDFLARWLWDI